MSTGGKNQLGSQDFHVISRIEAAAEYKFLGEQGFHDTASIFLDFPIYHDNRDALSARAHWLFCDDNRGDVALSSYGSAKGYVLFKDTYGHEPYSNDITLFLTGGGKQSLESSSEALYRSFLSYCVKHNVNLLLVEAPFVFTEQDVLESNTLRAIALEYKVPFLDFSFLLEGSGIDYETDFSDKAHVNILGAEKYTSFLASYISEKYDLPDHRGDDAFSSWNAEWNNFTKEQTPLKNQLARDVNGKND